MSLPTIKMIKNEKYHGHHGHLRQNRCGTGLLPVHDVENPHPGHLGHLTWTVYHIPRILKGGSGMFLTFSKMMAKIGGFKLGLGIRITKKNVLWMSWIVMIICMFQAVWYMMVICFWLMYAVMYGLWWCISAPFRKHKKVRD